MEESLDQLEAPVPGGALGLAAGSVRGTEIAARHGSGVIIGPGPGAGPGPGISTGTNPAVEPGVVCGQRDTPRQLGACLRLRSA